MLALAGTAIVASIPRPSGTFPDVAAAGAVRELDGGGDGEDALAPGHWSMSGAIDLAPFDPSVALLSSGEVVSIGDNGCDPLWNGARTGEVRVWKPGSNSWREVHGLDWPRARMLTVTLRDGRVLVAGGINSCTGAHCLLYDSFSSAWIFDVRANTWTRAGIMNEARGDPLGAVLRDGRVLVAGGFYASSGDLASLAEPKSQGEPVITTALARPAGSAPDVELADIDVGPPGGEAPALNTAELYDPATNRWSKTGPLLLARYGASAVTLVDGRVLVVGSRRGEQAAYSISTDERVHRVTEIYDPAVGRFRLAGELPLDVIDGALVALKDGNAMLIGGHGPASDMLPNRSVFLYVARENRWVRTTSLGTSRSGAAAVRLRDGRVLVAGGFDEFGPVRTAELFNPASRTWTKAPAMPTPRGGATALLLRDGTVGVFGGLGAHTHEGTERSWSCRGTTVSLRFNPGP